MIESPTIEVTTLQQWLASGEKVNVLDIRPKNEWSEWYIPGSIYFDVYDKLKAKESNVLEKLYIDKSIPVVTVCAGGKTSMMAAVLLRQFGFEAYSLKEGMKGWSLSWNTASISFPDFEVTQLRRTGKGCLSYIISSNQEAVIVDASLPVGVYEQILKENKLILKYVIETHIHADHLSRSKQLAQRNNAPLYLPVPNKVNFEFLPIDPAIPFQVGRIRMAGIQTPGHTLESTSFLVNENLILTGDTLFINGVGRPDLKSNTEETVLKATMLYQSLQKLMALPNSLIVLPAHTSNPVDFDKKMIQSTISDITNKVSMLHLNEEDFIESLLKKIPPTPPNYLSIVEKNIEGDFGEVNPLDLEAGANHCAIT